MEACVRHLTTLNRTACEVMQDFPIRAATDITGFGLAGHADEMARGAGVVLAVQMDQLPVMREALDMYRRGVTTGVNAHNRQMVQDGIRFDGDWPDWHREIVFDPQTSGGLLAAVDAGQADSLVAALHRRGVDGACRIGTVRQADEKIRLRFI
jgi:selenide,water dikinase